MSTPTSTSVTDTDTNTGTDTNSDKPASRSIAEIIQSRRTINFFQDQIPPKETILKALSLACWAPNHHLTEPWHFYLLGRETAEGIARLNADLVTSKSGAEAGQAKLKRWLEMPGWLVITCDNTDDELQAREDYAACCCAVQNLMLYLWSKDIGVKWTTGAVTRHPDFYDLIWADINVETVVGLLWYGYPAEIPHLDRKPLDMVMVELP